MLEMCKCNSLNRFGELILETQTHCFAWAYIPNHKKVWHEKDIESLVKKECPEANFLIFPAVGY
jgi:hypothetical protein